MPGDIFFKKDKAFLILFLFILYQVAINVENVFAQKNIITYISFTRPLRVNEINFFEISATQNLSETDTFLSIFNPAYKKSKFVFPLKNNTVRIEKKGGKFKANGYFFLPNIIPVGKARLRIASLASAIYDADIEIQPEIFFHNPVFRQGFPPLSVEAEVGMRKIIAESYPFSRIVFANPLKKSYLFFSVGLKKSEPPGFDQVKLKIYVKQRLLDEITITNTKRDYLYCLSKPYLGVIDWIKINFESCDPSGKPISDKNPIIVFDYINLLPYNGIPDWICNFIKSTHYVENKFICECP